MNPTDYLIAANRAALAGFPGLARALIELYHNHNNSTKGKP